MYKIFSEDGTVLAYAETLNYIRSHENGCFTTATEKTAEGIAVNGTAYSLLGHEALEGTESAVGVAEFDGAALVAQQEAIIDELLIASLEG